MGSRIRKRKARRKEELTSLFVLSMLKSLGQDLDEVEGLFFDPLYKHL
jgi:hypothetical protein